MGHCAPWVFSSLLFHLMHHFFHRQQEEPHFPSAQTTLSTWITYYSNLNSLFSENKLLESIFFCCRFSFLFFFYMSFNLSWNQDCYLDDTEIYTLLSYYNNDFTPSKKNSYTTTFQTSSFLYQRWQTLIVQIPNLIHCQGEKGSS